jgi:hypothetical protein
MGFLLAHLLSGLVYLTHRDILVTTSDGHLLAQQRRFVTQLRNLCSQHSATTGSVNLTYVLTKRRLFQLLPHHLRSVIYSCCVWHLQLLCGISAHCLHSNIGGLLRNTFRFYCCW